MILTATEFALTFKLRKFIVRVDLVFLLALGLGIGSALLFFTASLRADFRTHPEHIYALFFGLIAGSIVILVRELGRLRANDWIAMVAGALSGVAVINMVPFETPEASWFVFVAGALAISAMILPPGISGSFFILLLLQKYAYIFDAIGRFDFNIVFRLGSAVQRGCCYSAAFWLGCYGIFIVTLVTIIGILVASLWRIWPFQDRQYVVVRDKERLMASFPEIPGQFADTEIAALGLALPLKRSWPC